MTDATRGQLEKAYNLIQQERLDEALGLLQDIVARQPNNGDAWWLMANAVSEPEQAFDALTNVLRLNPHHVEAREAYDQLVSQFPTLAPRSPAPPATGPKPGTTANLTVDIDELLRSTGPLDRRSGSNMAMPDDANDVSNNYLDQLWAARDTTTPATAPAQGGADLSPSDLDALFGTGSAYNAPATTSEDEDLSALFMGEAPKSASGKPAVEDDLESLFGTGSETTTILRRDSDLTGTAVMQSPSADAGADMDLESFLSGGAGSVPNMEALAESEDAQSDLDLDALFGTPTDDKATQQLPSRQQTRANIVAKPSPTKSLEEDLFGQDTEPDFMKLQQAAPAEAVVEEKAARGRRRREKAAPQVDETSPIPAAPEPKRQKPVRVVAEPTPVDPFESERRANRRSRLPRLLLVVALVAIVLIVAFLVIQNQRVVAPPPNDVAQAATNLKNQLALDGFTDPNVVSTGDSIQVTVCSQPGTKLQEKLYQAMERVADLLGPVQGSLKSAQIVIVTCGKTDIRLFRATAPIEVVKTYLDSNRVNKAAYRNSWQRN